MTVDPALDILASAMSDAGTGRHRWAKAGLWILVFAVSFVAFDRLFLFGLRAGAARYYASLKADRLRSKQTAIYGQGDGDLLIFGSSRARYAFGQDSLSVRLNKRVIKEAAAGRFPKFFYYFYMKYRKDNSKPKVLLYGLDYFMFEKQSSPDELARLDKSIKLDSLNPAGAVNPASPLLSRVSLLFRKKPEIDGLLTQLLKFDAAPRTEENDRTNDEPAGPTTYKFYVVKPDRWQTRPYQPFPGVEGYFLEKLLTALEEDGVPVFLVLIPDSVATNDTNFEQDEFKANVRALAARHKNADVLDLNQPDIFDLGNTLLFNDGAWGRSNCHLTNRGMADFSRKLAVMIREARSQGTTGGGTAPGSRP